MDRTDSKIDTPMARDRSRPVQYEVVSYRGEIFGPFQSVKEAAKFAEERWPDQDQDEDREGHGWDVQVAGLRDDE